MTMPIYFSDVAPTCPISTDSSLGPRQAHLFNRTIMRRPTIPRVPNINDLQSAIMVANIARSIVTSLTNNRIINNIQPPYKVPPPSVAKDKHREKHARWSEQKDKRIKKKYKYYGRSADGGEKDPFTWVIMERIEKMVWYDRVWKSYLTWEYGDKGEGELVVSGTKTAAEMQQ